MQERIDIIDKISEDVNGLMRRVINNEIITEKDKEEQASKLRVHKRGDLVTLELLPQTLNSNISIREMALRGLIAVDDNKNESVKNKAVARMLLIKEDGEEGSFIRELASKYLENNQK